jgi:hypothetical protein
MHTDDTVAVEMTVGQMKALLGAADVLTQMFCDEVAGESVGHPADMMERLERADLLDAIDVDEDSSQTILTPDLVGAVFVLHEVLGSRSFEAGSGFDDELEPEPGEPFDFERSPDELPIASAFPD